MYILKNKKLKKENLVYDLARNKSWILEYVIII